MTRTRKLEWQSIDIPKPLFQTVRKLIVHTGDPSVAEYVRVATRDRVREDQTKLETDKF